MTSHEILKADVLDILFENRNKQYGAYALRKGYNQRLGTALGSSLTAAVLLAYVLGQSLFGGKDIAPAEGAAPLVLTPVEVIDPPAEPKPPGPPPQARPRPFATQTYLKRIEIVPEADPGEAVPQLADLQGRAIGAVTQEGDWPAGNQTTAPLPDAPAAGPARDDAPNEVFRAVERLPEFPGGVTAWSAFLGRHLQVPHELPGGERRTVLVKFWVGEDGRVGRFEVVQSAGAAFDDEVIRVLKKMPKWKPALQNGHPVAVTFTQPVTFQAVEE